MSAKRDKSQKAAFVYANLYNLFKKETSPILKTGEYVAYQPAELLGRRIEIQKNKESKNAEINAIREAQKTAPQPAATVDPTDTLESLKTNLKALTELHSRLHFMLKELEELSD